MAAGGTYELIAKTTVTTATGGLSTPITFSSIPSTYTDLVIILNGKVTSGASMYLRFNSDSGNNYAHTAMRGSSSSTSAERTNNVSTATWGVWRTTNPQYGILQIQNYANSTTYKPFLARSYDDTEITITYAGIWKNTNAIDSISFVCDTTYDVGTTISIYGIAAA